MSISKPILVVEDDSAIREFIEMALTEEGYAVVTAHDGESALKLALECQLSLILLDKTMPGMDGIAFLEAYQQTQSNLVPVILMTAGKQNIIENLPIVGLLPKPFNLDDLLAQVYRHLTA